MPSAAARDVLQAMLEQRAAQKRRPMAPAAAPMVLPFARRAPLKVYLNAVERDRVMGDQAPLPFSNRIAGAFDAAEGMPEPSQALYAAKHRRAQGLPPPTSFLEDVASLGPRAVGGAQKMAAAVPMAAEALYNDPLGSINSAGLAGQAATDAIVQGAVRPFTQFGDPNVDPVENAADIALTAMGGSAAIPAEENALRMGIKAYHGSPHDFERFDSSKIGTGEGAQAYGHGLYMAENEGVAKEYRDALKTTRFDTLTPEETYATGLVMPALEAAFKKGGAKAAEELLDKHIVNSRRFIESQPGAGEEATLSALEKLKANKEFYPKEHAHMYEVDIAADPEHFLDWDKPLSEQSPQVQQAALGTAQPPDPGALRKRAETASGAEKDFLLNQASYLENQLRMHGEGWHGSAVAENLPSEWDDFETARRIARAKVAEQLKERGAAGIRYLDQGSRAPAATQPQRIAKLEQDISDLRKALASPPEWTKTTKGWSEKAWVDANAPRLQDMEKELDAVRKEKPGTHNYVVFPGNEHLIAILKKYGLPISAAGLAALSQLHPQEAQAAPQQNLPRY